MTFQPMCILTSPPTSTTSSLQNILDPHPCIMALTSTITPSHPWLSGYEFSYQQCFALHGPQSTFALIIEPQFPTTKDCYSHQSTNSSLNFPKLRCYNPTTLLPTLNPHPCIMALASTITSSHPWFSGYKFSYQQYFALHGPQSKLVFTNSPSTTS
jgi:hypothetical protein